MSTQTGPAYAVKNNINIMEIPDSLESVRASQEHAIMESFVADAIFAYDEQEEHDGFADFLPVFLRKEVDSKKDLSEFSPYIDGLLKAKIAFYYNKVRKETYVRLMGFTDESIKLFETLPFIDREVTYQNSSDSQLSKITEEEWHDRQKIWDELDLRARTYPTVLSVSIMNALIGRYKLLRTEVILKAWDTFTLPTYEARASRLFVGKYCSLLFEAGEDSMSTLSYSIFFKYVANGESDYTRLYKPEENADAITQTCKYVEEQLDKRKL